MVTALHLPQPAAGDSTSRRCSPVPRARQTAITVAAGNPVRINIKLEVGALNETVQVAADTTLQTDKSDLSTQLNSKEITDPAAEPSGTTSSRSTWCPARRRAVPERRDRHAGRSLRTWVNGTQPNSNATRIDGAVSVNIWLPHRVGYVQPRNDRDRERLDQQLRRRLRHGRRAAATVVTKSGTNNVKGSAFWFGNTEEMNANSYFNNAFGRAKDPASRNIYGATVGGPVIHNKLFYFGSIESFNDRRGSQANYGVPTARMRNGDFGEVAAAYPGFRLYNPFTGAASGAGRELFPNNTIPSSMINGVARDVMSYYPMPTRPRTSTRTRSSTTTSSSARSGGPRQLRPQDDVAAEQPHSIWASSRPSTPT